MSFLKDMHDAHEVAATIIEATKVKDQRCRLGEGGGLNRGLPTILFLVDFRDYGILISLTIRNCSKTNPSTLTEPPVSGESDY